MNQSENKYIKLPNEKLKKKHVIFKDESSIKCKEILLKPVENESILKLDDRGYYKGIDKALINIKNKKTDNDITEVMKNNGEKEDEYQNLSYLKKILEKNKENIYKVFKCTLRHCCGPHENCYLIFSTCKLYLSELSIGNPLIINFIGYEEISSIQVDPFMQSFSVCGRFATSSYVHIGVGDREICSSILGYIEYSIVKNTSKPPYFLNCFSYNYHTIRQIGEWLSKANMLEDSPLFGMWLVFYEDGSYTEPPVNKTHIEEFLMACSNIVIGSWKPAYCILRENVLCKYNNAQDPTPSLIVDLKRCSGCSLLKSSRPHAFQISKMDNTTLILAASNEHSANLWVQSILYGILNKVEPVRLLSCQLVVSSRDLFLLNHFEEIFSQINKKSKESSESIHNVKLNSTKEKENKILSSQNFSQISKISLVDKLPVCHLEFECSEALEMFGTDWILHFRTSKELGYFIELVSRQCSNYGLSVSSIIGKADIEVEKKLRATNRRTQHWN